MAGRDVPMSVRRLIVEVDLDGLNVREFCRQHGVSTWFFYDLRRRWARDGDAALEPKSRAPKRVASTAMAACTGAGALAAVADAAATLGWPQRIQSDNANSFRHVLADALRPLGVTAAHSRPNHPQTNGKVERFHQSEQKWLG